MENNGTAVRKIVSKIIKKDPSQIDLNDDLIEKYGMDSMQRVEIVIELEKQFNIEISDEVSIKLRTLKNILDLVQNEASTA